MIHTGLLHLAAKKELQVAKRLVGKYPESFRRIALERMKNCSSISALADELGIHRTILYKWLWQAEADEEGAEPKANSSVRALRKQVRDLKRVLAEKTLEVDFFKGALQKIEARRKSGGGSGETASTTKSGK
jgi:transposase-like protein